MASPVEKAEAQKKATEKANVATSAAIRDDNAFISSACLRALKSGRWVADSGASEHMTDSRSSFLQFTPVEAGTWRVNGVGNTKISVMGTGTVAIQNFLPDGTRDGLLQNVLYAPGLGGDLLSIGAMSSSQAIKTGLRFYEKPNLV